MHACMFVTIYMVYVRPDNQYHAHPHCLCTLALKPDIAQRKQNNNSNRKWNKKETAHKGLVNNKNQQLQILLISLHSPFDVLYSVLVRLNGCIVLQKIIYVGLNFFIVLMSEKFTRYCPYHLANPRQFY